MKRAFNFLFLIPLAIVLILLSVANRTPVTFNLDPLNAETPALSFDLPLFVLLFIALIIGLVIGGCLTWMSQGKYRRALREKAYEANQLQREKTSLQPEKNEAREIAPGLPAISQ